METLLTQDIASNYKRISGFLASVLKVPILAPVTTEYGLSKVNEQ